MANNFFFQRQSQNKSPKGLISLVVIILFFLTVFWFRISPPAFLSGAAVFVSEPILVVKNGVWNTFGNFFSLLHFKRTLISENAELKNKLEDLQGVEANLKLLQTENETLRQAVGTFEGQENMLVLSVIRKPGSLPYDTILVGSGSGEGIVKGNLVYAGAHVLVGTVGEAYTGSSKITLFSSPGEITQGFAGPGGIPVELHGIGGGNFEVKIPREADVLVGDAVFVTTKNSDVIGVVSSLAPVPNDALLSGIVTTPVNIFELTHLFVEKGVSAAVSFHK